MRKKHVLVVDDEQRIRTFLALALSREGFAVTTAADVTDALKLIRIGAEAPETIDILLTDYNMPGNTGLELVDTLRLDGFKFPFLLMSGSPNELLAAQALSRGCAGFIKKPFNLSAMIDYIHAALEIPAGDGLINMELE